jgi:hypothetical protein
MRLGGERLLFGLLVVGCLMLTGIPLPGWVGDSWGSAAVASAQTTADADAGLSGRAGPVAGVWLPLCRISDAPGSDDVVFTDRAAAEIARPRVAVRDTLAAGSTQPLMASARVDRLRPTVAPARDAVRDPGRPRALVPLYLAMTSLHTLDIVSTRRALGAGGSEANPLMASMAGSGPSPGALRSTSVRLSTT